MDRRAIVKLFEIVFLPGCADGCAPQSLRYAEILRHLHTSRPHLALDDGFGSSLFLVIFLTGGKWRWIRKRGASATGP
jgi:hypothetical protein